MSKLPLISPPKDQRIWRTWLVAVLLSCAAGEAIAATAAKGGASEALFFAQIMLLLGAGRVMGELMQRIGHPAVMGQLIAGMLLGRSALGALWPEGFQAVFPDIPEQKAMLNAVAQFGVLMLLLLTGMETDLKLVRKTGKAAFTVSMTGIAVPFACGVTLGEMLPAEMLPNPDQRLITSLFLGTALSISSVKIVAMVIREMNFMRRNVGQVIVASAIIDDTIGWIIIAITFGLVTHGSLDPAALAKSVLGTLLFLALAFTLGRRIVFHVIRWTNDKMASEFAVITVILIIMTAMALTTHAIGVHTVLGAFVAGILVGQSPILTRHIDEQLRGLIIALFMPIFFSLSGLSVDLTILADPKLLMLSLAMIAIASVGKFGGAFLGGRLGGLSWRESLALGCGMNARGSTEVIVATLGLSMGALSQDLFTMIVAMAVVTTMAMPPMLRSALRALPLGEEEKTRLEHEAFEEKAFIAKLERLLVATDDGSNGKFASRLTGLLAGSRGMPVTVLHLAEEQAKPGPGKEAAAAGTVAAAAEKAQAKEQEQAEPVPVTTTRQADETPKEAVAREARKGYDLLMIGQDNSENPDGHFDEAISRLALGFDGPLGIAIARGVHARQPVQGGLDILVPVSGSGVSHRAAEFAFALARAGGGRVTAIYVSREARRRMRRHEEEILKTVSEAADQYEVNLRTVIRTGSPPADAILRQAERGDHSVILLGVNRRPGESLFFGEVAAELLKRSKRSLLLLSS